MSTTYWAALKRTVISRFNLGPLENNVGSIGTGSVYSFDPVGSYEREACRAAGAAQSLVQPFLDNQASHTAHLTARAIDRVYNTILRPETCSI